MINNDTKNIISVDFIIQVKVNVSGITTNCQKLDAEKFKGKENTNSYRIFVFIEKYLLHFLRTFIYFIGLKTDIVALKVCL